MSWISAVRKARPLPASERVAEDKAERYEAPNRTTASLIGKMCKLEAHGFSRGLPIVKTVGFMEIVRISLATLPGWRAWVF
jgi:hypothetical protein